MEYCILFLCIWYLGLLKAILTEGTVGSYGLFLLAGLLPLFTTFKKIQNVLYYRSLHRQCMNRPPRQGRIINCRKNTYREPTSRGRSRLVTEYTLMVEVGMDAELQPIQIESEPYSWPVYRVLAAPEVDVYTDPSGWHHVIDGWQYKTDRNDSGLFPETALDKAPVAYQDSPIFRILTILIMLAMLFNILR